MNKTVELVTEWGAFEERHPGADIGDFCRHYLISQREKDRHIPLEGGDIPWHHSGVLLKLMGRISKLNTVFAAKALEGTGVDQLEEFGMLLTVRRLKNPRKTEIIYANIFELSSGTDMLNRLRNKGFVKEHEDKKDKRSKRVSLTAAGQKAIDKCAERMMKCAGMMLAEMSDEDVTLCTQLLKNVEIKFAAVWQQHKGESFEVIYTAAHKTNQQAHL
ncbi:MAG TPA: winged helix DNA-binding protein [Puia sp.]